MTSGSPSPSSGRGVPPQRSGLTKVAYALVPLVLLLLLLELGLWVTGMGDSTELPSVSRGFDPQTAYLVPVGKGWRTHLYGGRDRETVIPPKGEARRVLLVGGSNTEVFPDGYLAEILASHYPYDGDYEVFNLGRAGYGSARVAILLEQALAVEPDVVVIYSGHNEFVERGLAIELERRMGGAGGALGQGLGTLRVYRQLEQALRGSDVERQGEVDPAAEVSSYDVTLAVCEAYRRNIARMCDRALEAGVDVVLCTVVSNDFSPPFLARASEPGSAEVMARSQRLRKRAEALMPPGYSAGLSPPVRLSMPIWARGKALPAGASSPVLELPTLRTLSGSLADAPATPAEREGDASMEGRHWPPRRSWGSKVLPLLQTMERFARRRLSDQHRTDLIEARRLLFQALELQPDHAAMLFRLGLISWLIGDDDAAARILLRRSQVADWAPHSGNDLTNDAVRTVAAERPGVRLVDAAKMFAERSPAGVVGYEVMMDGCHLHPGARRVLMVDLLPAIALSWEP